MEEKILEKEIAMCRRLSQKNNGRCNWGECDKCGVIPLLHKICKGEIFEDENEVKKLKEDILNGK